jgi:hypothetical protein
MAILRKLLDVMLVMLPLTLISLGDIKVAKPLKNRDAYYGGLPLSLGQDLKCPPGTYGEQTLETGPDQLPCLSFRHLLG